MEEQMDSEFIQKMHEEMSKSTKEFMNGVSCMSREDWNSAFSWFDRACLGAEKCCTPIGSLLKASREWLDAYCAQMFCRMSQEIHSDVVQMDEKFHYLLNGKAIQSMTGPQIMIGGALPSACGWVWYFDATVSSYDQLNMFDEAIRQANMAIGYFDTANSFGNKGNYLFRKASVLQQRASLRSQSPEAYDTARQDIIDSVEAMYMTLEICCDNWESDCGPLLEVQAKVSKRLGVTKSDFSFMRWDSQAGQIISIFFPTTTEEKDELNFSEAIRHLNCACRARDDGKHQEAENEFLLAFEAATEVSPRVKALKAFISYQYGVYLLRRYGLENKKGSDLNEIEFEVLRKINKYWDKALVLTNDIDNNVLSSFDFPIENAIQCIKADSRIRYMGHVVCDDKTGKLKMRSLSGQNSSTSDPKKPKGFWKRLFGGD